MVFVAARGGFGLDLSLSLSFFLPPLSSSLFTARLFPLPPPLLLFFSLGMLVPPPVVNDGCFWSWLNGEVWCWLLFVVENGGLFMVHWVLCFGSTTSPAGWWRLPVRGGLEAVLLVGGGWWQCFGAAAVWFVLCWSSIFLGFVYVWAWPLRSFFGFELGPFG